MSALQREVETHIVALKGSSANREQNNLFVLKFVTAMLVPWCECCLPTVGSTVFAQALMTLQGSGLFP